MQRFSAICLVLIFSFLFFGCSLDTLGGGAFNTAPEEDASTDRGGDALPDVDAGDWPEASVDDADASPEAKPDAAEDVSPDVTPDSPLDVADEPDAAEDVVEADVPEDAPEDAIDEDSPVDAPEDVVEADVPNSVLCFGVPAEDDNLMICAELPGGTSKSLTFKAELQSSASGQSFPWKSVCWGEVGVAELACFPCPGNNLCWPQPDAGLPRVSGTAGDVIKFQPGIADVPGGDMMNTLCDLGKCLSGSYVLYSGHEEVCRVEPNGDISGRPGANAHYEGSGTDARIVCTL